MKMQCAVLLVLWREGVARDVVGVEEGWSCRRKKSLEGDFDAMLSKVERNEGAGWRESRRVEICLRSRDM